MINMVFTLFEDKPKTVTNSDEGECYLFHTHLRFVRFGVGSHHSGQLKELRELSRTELKKDN